MADLAGTASLHEVGLEILKLFKQIQSAGAATTEGFAVVDWPYAAITAEADRFEFWSINLGLFVPGHGSLDYRLRQADSLKHTIGMFLRNLQSALLVGGYNLDHVFPGLQNCVLALDYRANIINASVETFSEDRAGDTIDSDAFQDEDDLLELGSDGDVLLDSIKDPIDRLYKVSTWVRNPSSRLPAWKALHHQELDAESNVDLIQVFAGFDYDYVSSVFLQHKKNKALKDSSEPQLPIQEVQDKDADKVWEPIQTLLSEHRTEVLEQTESFLVRRIAQANVRRRQLFFYWRKHREKKDQHSTTATQHIVHGEKPQHNTVPTALSVTTASQLPKTHLAIKDDESQAPVSEYAPTVSLQDQKIVSFPPAPKRPSGAGFFECPYCFTLCSKAILGQKAWKAHLIHDLQPYMCTYQDCKNPYQLYDTRQDWIDHENTHRNVFRCPEHQSRKLNTSSELELHFLSEHDNYDRQTSENFVKHAIDSVSILPDRDCPICSSSRSTLKALRDHIALHLEDLSLFSLPRSVIESQTASGEVESDQANISAAGSPAEDFNADTESTLSSSMSSSDLYKIEPLHREAVRLTETVLGTEKAQPSSVENWLTKTSDTKTASTEIPSTSASSKIDRPGWKWIYILIDCANGETQKVIARLDTASSFNVISEDMLNQLGKDKEEYDGPDWLGMTLRNHIIGKVTLQWHYQARKSERDPELHHEARENEFVVLDSRSSREFDVIIGQDTIIATGIYPRFNRDML